MAMKKLDLISLAQLDDGKIAETFGVELMRCVNDCEDRPLDANPRTITLQITLKPVTIPGTNELDDVKVQAKCDSTLPKRQTRAYSMAARHGGLLVFNEDSPNNIHQQTLLDDEDANDD